VRHIESASNESAGVMLSKSEQRRHGLYKVFVLLLYAKYIVCTTEYTQAICDSCMNVMRSLQFCLPCQHA
jgi:hypothetical protein